MAQERSHRDIDVRCKAIVGQVEVNNGLAASSSMCVAPKQLAQVIGCSVEKAKSEPVHGR